MIAAAMVLWLVPVAVAYAQGAIGNILVEGNQRIEPETVRSYLKVQPGDRFDPQRVDESVRALFATGLFSDVSIRQEGPNLIVQVIENPIINRVIFEGNRRLDDSTLSAEVSLQPRSIYTRSKVLKDVERIKAIYRVRGRFNAIVEPKIIRRPQNRIDLVFEITEGEVTKVETIRFVGNKEFSDSRLRSEIRTEEEAWYKFFTINDTYEPNRVNLDSELLRQFYVNRGFLDFQVVSAVAELTPDHDRFIITFTVDEGPRYKFGKVDAEVKLPGVEKDDVLDLIDYEEGDWYNVELVSQTADTIVEEISKSGPTFVEAKPRFTRNRENNSIDVTLVVQEGERVVVERIDIRGNVRTLDEVIRREFRLVEGDAFNASKLRRSKERIENLDFFGSVEVEAVEGTAPDKRIINVNVEEKSTGSFSIGGGFSTSVGPLAQFSIQERNLLGKGQSLGLFVTLAAEQSQINLQFTEPAFLERDLAFSMNAFNTRQDQLDESGFESQSTGAGFGFAYPLSERIGQSWNYSFSRDEVTDVDQNASIFIRAQEGVNTTSKISHTLSYDSRDSRRFPTKGWLFQLTTAYAGPGGSVDFLQNTGRLTKYYALAEEWIMSFTGRGGHIFGLRGDNVRLFNRFFLGGSSLRGFEVAGVGPRDLATNDSLGGKTFFSGVAQLTFPLGLPKEFGISGRLFTDAGTLFGLDQKGPTVADRNSIRMSVGGGIQWRSPIGPVGVDLAFPIVKEPFDEREIFRVNFGTSF